MSKAGLELKLQQRQPIPLDVEIDCDGGEMLALVGPSGSGKTTILRSIAGLYQPRSGYVRCGGETWLARDRGIDMSTQERRIGFVFQDYALFPHQTALRNITTALSHLDAGARDARAHELLAQVNLTGLEDRLPAHLSGGQRQRVALARALAREPRILLLDEPFSAVDQITRRKLQQELVVLRHSIDIPIVLVTHDLYEAASLADRLYVVHRGKTLQNGTPDDVLRYPRNALVARLVGHSNIFSATIDAHDTEAGVTRILWRGTSLEVALDSRYEPGSAVDWVIHPAHVVMHRRDRPSLGERENPLRGVVREIFKQGESLAVNLELDVEGDDATVINFSINRHSAERNALRVDAEVGISLLADGIHLMTPEDRAAVRGRAE